MRTITISDKATTGVLAFDLLDLLEVLADREEDMLWQVLSDLECTGESADQLQELALSGARVSRRELAGIARGVKQVIDGEFQGYSAGQSIPTLLLRAVDSSSWDVASERNDLLDAFRQRFRAVIDAGDAY